MKPVFHSFRAGVLPAVAIALLLSGCGQKGPLYLPAKPATPVTTAPATPTANSKPDNK